MEIIMQIFVVLPQPIYYLSIIKVENVYVTNFIQHLYLLWNIFASDGSEKGAVKLLQICGIL